MGFAVMIEVEVVLIFQRFMSIGQFGKFHGISRGLSFDWVRG